MKYTKFTGLQADQVKGGVAGAVALTKSASYSLTAAEKAAPAVIVTMSAASKVLTLGLADGQMMVVVNAGATNAFTVKNVSGDTGTSLAANASKALLVIGNSTANASTVIALN